MATSSSTWSKDNPPKQKGKHLSDNWKRNISKSKKGKPLSKEARKKAIRNLDEYRKINPSPMKGKHHSLETRTRMSEKNKEIFGNGYYKTHTPPMLGKHHTLETRQRIREKGSISHKEYYKTHPSPRKGVKLSDETKQLVREARLKQVFPKKDTDIERAMQSKLRELGIPFVTHTPVCKKYQSDIFIEPNIIIFCDGTRWHADPEKYKENDKVIRDVTAKDCWVHDAKVIKEAEEAGYIVLRFWARDIFNNMDKCISAIKSKL